MAPENSGGVDSSQAPLAPSAARQSYGTGDQSSFTRHEISNLIDITLLLRLVIIALTFASFVLYLIGNEYTRVLNALAAITLLTFLWNLCFVLITKYFPQTWKRRSDNEEPRKPYRRLAPLNDAWLSGYIFMFTLWAKLVMSNQENTPNTYKVDAVFVLNCIVFVISYLVAVFEQFEISWSRSLRKLVRTDSYHGQVQLS